MDDRRGDGARPGPAGLLVNERVVVQARVEFAAVTDAAATDSISRDLAAGRFPVSTRAAVEYLQAMIPPGGRVLDLGTHVGSFTLAAAALGYEVVGVEASPRNAEVLRASLEKNGFARARLVHAAVSDREGTLEFSHGGPFGHVGVPSMGKTTVAVPARRVDDITAELGWDRVDFIKMDIEGSEVAGLRGMTRLLSGSGAPPLFVESNGHTLGFFDQTPRALKAALAEYGYRCYLVELGRLCPVATDDFQPTTCVDYLATKRPPRDARGIILDRPLSRAELAFRAAGNCASPAAADRLYVARALAAAGPKLLAARAIREAVMKLRGDADERVRAAADAVPLSRSGPWGPTVKAVPRPHIMDQAGGARSKAGGNAGASGKRLG